MNAFKAVSYATLCRKYACEGEPNIKARCRRKARRVLNAATAKMAKAI